MANYYYTTATDTATATGNIVWNTSASTTVGSIIGTGSGVASAYYAPSMPNKIPAGAREIELPDGAKLVLDDLGNYRIEDADAKVTYRANRVREFSPHLNASDMLAKFVKYVGSIGIKQSEVLGLPIELFINWLIIEAAERDKDPVPDGVVPVQQHPGVKVLLKPKCLRCGRFIPMLYRKNRFQFCGIEHAKAFLELANIDAARRTALQLAP